MNAGPRTGLADLRRLASLYGIQTSYLDMDKVRLWASAEALLAALQALGAPIQGTADLKAAALERLRELWAWHLEPVAVSWDKKPVSIALRLPDGATGLVHADLRLETGEAFPSSFDLESLAVTATQSLGSERFVERQIVLSRAGFGPAEALPFGYHQFSLTFDGRRLESTIISAPTRFYETPPKKRWGLFAPLYALHSGRSWGVGDLTDLSAFVDYASGQQADFVSTLPILASFLDSPCEPSPYSPVSRLFWNELFVDPALPPGVSSNVKRPSEASKLNKETLVPYRDAMALKRSTLERQASEFLANPAGGAELDAFLDTKPETRDYARFRAATERLGPNWHDWPAKQRAGELLPKDFDQGIADYHAYAQWRIDTQLNAVAASARAQDVSLYLDLPIGVHAQGYDAWRYQSLFVNAVSVGAPPDPVTTSGQNWGFPPIDPEAQRRSGYKYLRDYLDHHLKVAGVLRLDHVMGMHRLYWVPAGGDAKDGLYIRNPFDELYAVHSLQSHRHSSVIIGEDLGVASRELPRNLNRHRVTRLYVVEISLWGPPEDPLLPIPQRVAASIGTHDLPPFASWWQDMDIEGRKELGVLDEHQAALESQGRGPKRQELMAYLRGKGLLAPNADRLQEVLDALLALLGESAAEWLTISLEDLWLETDSQNLPGTNDVQHPNWRRRAAHAVEELPKLKTVSKTLATVREARGRT